MRKALVLPTLAATLACGSSPTSPVSESTPDPAVDLSAQCFALEISGAVAPGFSLPHLIELTRQPAPNFIEPGRFVVREPGVEEPRAPISWWMPTGNSSLELVLGGGFTGYTFSLTGTGTGWAGQGEYCADFGLEPPPEQLGLRLIRQSCP